MSTINVSVNGQPAASVNVDASKSWGINVTGQAGTTVVATNGDTVNLSISQAGSPGGQGIQGPPGEVNLSDATPLGLGAASAGSSANASRADHVHPVPTISYSSLTNVPSTFTPAAHNQAASTITGLANVATSGSASDLTLGTLPAARLPTATSNTLGAIKVGSGLTIAAGVLSATGGGSGNITLSSSTPSALGTAAAGSSNLASRSDHVHAVPSASAITTGTLAAARLPLATNSTAGAVIVGNGLSVTNGTISASGGFVTYPDQGTSNGTAGQLAYDEYGYLYLCYATNKWTKFTGAKTFNPYARVLCHFDSISGSSFVDSSLYGVLVDTQSESTTLSTAQSKFGGASLRLNGGGVLVGYNGQNDLTTEAPSLQSPWTVEMWVRFDDIAKAQPIFRTHRQTPIVNTWQITYVGADASDTVGLMVRRYISGGDQRIIYPWSPSANTWYHVAVQLPMADRTIWIDGQKINTTPYTPSESWPFQAFENDPVVVSFDGARIGVDSLFSGADGYMTGYMDEFRLSNTARYEDNFTPATSAFSR